MQYALEITLTVNGTIQIVKFQNEQSVDDAIKLINEDTKLFQLYSVRKVTI